MRDELLKNLLRECSAYITEETKEIYSLVPGSGNEMSRIMFIGSGPSAKEEATGIFLEGKAGEAFDDLLTGCELTRDDVYMTYAVKYRPYAISEKSGRIVARDITDDEIVMFSKYLAGEIELIKPHLVVTLGEVALKGVAGAEVAYDLPLGEMKALPIGELIYDVLPMPHPKDKGFKKMASNDNVVELLKKLAGEGVSGKEDAGTGGSASKAGMTGGYGKASMNVDADETVEDFTGLGDFEEITRATKSAVNYDKPGKADTSVEPKEIEINRSNATLGQSDPLPEYDDMDYNEQLDFDYAVPAEKRPAVRRQSKNASGKKNVIVVYGGTNLADDPTYVVADRISGVLAELNVAVKRIDLYKNDYSIDAFVDELESSEGVILATTVEWFGIGGTMQTFLDKCFRSGRFEAFKGAYLLGVVISRQSFERDAYNHLIKSWEILGGVEGISLLASIGNSADLETDNELLLAVDKKAEDYYRILNQQRLAMPTSIQGNRVLIKVPVRARVDEGEQMMIKTVVSGENRDQTIENQMSFISNYDEFIEKQQKDIEDLSSLFKEKLTSKSDIIRKTFPEIFEYKYKPDKSFSDCKISWVVNDRTSESFVLEFSGARLKATFGKNQGADVVITSSFDVLSKITEGKLTVQRAFMTGDIKAKGNFTLLYKLDQLFAFS